MCLSRPLQYLLTTMLLSSLQSIIAGPLSIEESLENFEIHDGYQITLVSSEPTIVDPVDFAFDEFGRLWVVEMRDYPNGPAAGEQPLSCIKLLVDPDRDGLYDRATVFADNLLFANGILPWKKGVIATMSGQVVYFSDHNDDGVADEQQVWFTGFAEENPQLRVNHPTLGPDGWIYLANGLRGGQVKCVHPQWPASDPIELRGKDFRFHPVHGKYEAISGNGQYGMCFNRNGQRLICSNRNPCMQVMFDFEQLKSQPRAIIRSLTKDISPAGADSRLAPLTGNWTTSNLHQGQFTAACGVFFCQQPSLSDPGTETIDALAFCCDPTANLIHRDVLTGDASSLNAIQPHQEKEFLASRDEWFRPVNLKLGPDGSLYVADMYRAVIEHPQFMPDELKKRPDLTLGNERGRIWRITKTTGQTRQISRNNTLDREVSATSPKLMEWLSDENAWQRETAFRLMAQSPSLEHLKLVEKLVHSRRSEHHLVAALSVYHLLGKIEADHLQIAFNHESPMVKIHALRILQRSQEENSQLSINTNELIDDVLKCLQHPQGSVRFEAIKALQVIPVDSKVIQKQLITAWQEYPVDDWVLLAAQYAVPASDLEDFLFALLSSSISSEYKTFAIQEFARLIGRVNDVEQVNQLLITLFQSRTGLRDQDFAYVLISLGEGLRARGVALGKTLLERLQNSENQAIIDSYHQSAMQLHTTAVEAIEPGQRLTAIQMLEFLQVAESKNILRKLVMEQATPADLRVAALNSLQRGAYSSSRAEHLEFIALVREETPLMRRELIDYCLNSSVTSMLLLQQIDAGELSIHELADDQKRRLSRSKLQPVRVLYQNLIAAITDQNREEVIATYQQALAKSVMDEASAERGKEIFKQHCSVCHRIGSTGVQVAPDISDTRTKKPADLLVSILDPNRAIDNNYFSYTAVTHAGKIITGILAEETPLNITLKQAKGTTTSLARNELEAFASDGISFMPQQFEKNISPEQMADLISYLKNWRYLEQNVPFVVSP